MLCIKEVNCRIILPSGMILDYCAGTFSLAKAGILLPQHRWIVGRDLDCEYVALSLLQVVFLSAHRVEIMEPDITADDGVHRTTSTSVEAMKELDLKRRMKLREAPDGFPICKHFRSMFSTIYQYNIWRILFLIKRKTSQPIFGHLADVCG